MSFCLVLSIPELVHKQIIRLFHVFSSEDSIDGLKDSFCSYCFVLPRKEYLSLKIRFIIMFCSFFIVFQQLLMAMFIISKIIFTLLVNLDLLFQSFLCVGPNLGILFFKCFSFLIDLGKLLFDFDHKLLVSYNHHISEKDELVVVVEDVVYVFNWFLF